MDTYTGSSETELLAKLARTPGPNALEVIPRASGKTGDGSDSADAVTAGGNREGDSELKAAEALIETFSANVDVARLLKDIREHAGARASADTPTLPPPPATGGPLAQAPLVVAPTTGFDPRAAVSGTRALEPRAKANAEGSHGGDGGERLAGGKSRTRKEIEAAASKEGASGG